ncbi:MAG TPA: cyclin [Gammaproteobacteria bacterium]|nr:cyclin [Gammaproteobacteria bacterium]
MQNRKPKKPEKPYKPVVLKQWSQTEISDLQRNAQQLLTQSTGIINDKLGIPSEPAPEIKYDESAVKKKLVAAIARQYEEKLTADKSKPIASSVFKICDDADPVIGMENYLKRFLSLDKISVKSFLHMTLMIDTWFRYHPGDRFGRENCYGLITTSLYVAHLFHEGDFDFGDYCKPDVEKKNVFPRRDLSHRGVYCNFDFSVKTGISTSKLGNWKDRFEAGIKGEFHYTAEQYHAAEARFLLPEDRHPAPGQLTSDLAGFEPSIGEEKTIQMTGSMDREIREKLIERLADRFSKRMEETKSQPPVISLYDAVPKQKISLRDYLARFIFDRPDCVVDLSVSAYIYLAIFLEAWLECNREGGFHSNSEKVSLKQSNCYLAILVSFMHAQNFAEDDNVSVYDKKIAAVGGVPITATDPDDQDWIAKTKLTLFGHDVSYEGLLVLNKNFFMSLASGDKSFFCSTNLYELYKRYHNELLPEYNLDLTLRPVSTAEKNEEDGEEERVNHVITRATRVFDGLFLLAENNKLRIQETLFKGSWIDCSLKDYMLRIRKFTKASAETFIYMIVFLDIYLSHSGDNLNETNAHRLLFTSFVIAYKQKYPGGKQNNHTNEDLVKIAGFSLSDLNAMEEMLLKNLTDVQFRHAHHESKSLSGVYETFRKDFLANHSLDFRQKQSSTTGNKSSVETPTPVVEPRPATSHIQDTLISDDTPTRRLC